MKMTMTSLHSHFVMESDLLVLVSSSSTFVCCVSDGVCVSLSFDRVRSFDAARVIVSGCFRGVVKKKQNVVSEENEEENVKEKVKCVLRNHVRSVLFSLHLLLSDWVE